MPEMPDLLPFFSQFVHTIGQAALRCHRRAMQSPNGHIPVRGRGPEERNGPRQAWGRYRMLMRYTEFSNIGGKQKETGRFTA